jgi:hypothetical protein
MLLEYIYFLNENNTKKISCGIHAETFLSNVILSHNKKQIIFNLQEWQDFYMFLQNNVSITSEKVNICDGLKIKNDKDGNFVLHNHQTKIILSIQEWNKLNLLFEYFNCVMLTNNNYQMQIHEYFDQYVIKCIVNQVSFLTSNFFFYTK